MQREEILSFINKIIKIEHGQEIQEDDLLEKSQIDSFAYAIFWLEIQDKYILKIKRKYKNEDEYSQTEYNKDVLNYINGIDYSTYKVKYLINRIIRCM